jgi:hypothetical protein
MSHGDGVLNGGKLILWFAILWINDADRSDYGANRTDHSNHCVFTIDPTNPCS